MENYMVVAKLTAADDVGASLLMKLSICAAGMQDNEDVVVLVK